ncbi:hypothetical protein SAMN05892883_3117 [Jatrophihabitans sp. GAS493]|uniref:hypothetical protein n=1 Tax=Jatrophihabitans sp. GAS493 TaxID=1907575 RepID=UPI000BC0C828|nr:hypothetical protein [Jatrophihabitans sp. GAS493]SOD73927.1 hypothetical protein SAMN05892883_3117 [Jatrophihabitans sp. GAS493]
MSDLSDTFRRILRVPDGFPIRLYSVLGMWGIFIVSVGLAAQSFAGTAASNPKRNSNDGFGRLFVLLSVVIFVGAALVSYISYAERDLRRCPGIERVSTYDRFMSYLPQWQILTVLGILGLSLPIVQTINAKSATVDASTWLSRAIFALIGIVLLVLAYGRRNLAK